MVLNCEKNKIVGVVITYNFQIDNLVKNIDRYLFGLDKLIIWQNSPFDCSDKKKIKNLRYSERIEFWGDGENKGICVPINEVISKIGSEFKYIMTMDQDSYWYNFEEYLYSINNYKQKSDGYIFGPKTLVAKLTNIEELEYIKDKSIDIVDFVITSGAIYEINIFRKIGCFKESYFIDAVDEEICYRAKNHNILSLRVNNAILIQTFGDPEEHSFFRRKVMYNKYSSKRLYYIVRNHIKLVREYKFPFKKKFEIIYSYVIRVIIMIILFDEDRIVKLKEVFKGIKEGMNSQV